MSDPKRASLITVGASNNGKNNIVKTVRLTINLDESNESKYPELNYKELVIAEEHKKVENGKTTGLDPFSDNDDDVERVARKFEQKYGGKSTYGRKKGRRKRDEFADIGAGYDENDSFIDNTDGYDEMFPPEVDTYLGGFYINCGMLEFKASADNPAATSDAGSNRNKRRISSSSSSESSESSSESESADEKEPKPVANGDIDSHKTEHRKKKNKTIEKKAKKIRRTDSSAATSGKQTSDDNGHGDAESADSRTSHSDSVTSKRAPSSENVITSDSSRDIEVKTDMKLPPGVTKVLEDMESTANKLLETVPSSELDTKIEPYVLQLQRTLSESGIDAACQRAAWTRASKIFGIGRAKLSHKARTLVDTIVVPAPAATSIGQVPVNSAPSSTKPALATVTTMSTVSTQNNKRKAEEIVEEDISGLTLEQREKKIVETLDKLKQLIEEKKPDMMASYNAECERVQEERKQLQMALASEGAPYVEKRLPKRRFPWCQTSRALLARLRSLAGDSGAAHSLLMKRALPLFPTGFVRMPTLLRQADLNKEVKSDVKRQRVTSSSQPSSALPNSAAFTEPIHFPSSLTVTASVKHTSMEKSEVGVGTDDKDPKKTSSIFGTILNSFSLSKDLVVEKERKESVIVEKSKEELYIPPNSIGSITITAVPNQQKSEKKPNNVANDKKEPLLRVKSPAALNEMVKKENEKRKKSDKNPKEKRVNSPLHIDTSYQTNKKEPSPSLSKIEEISKKQIEQLRVAENNIPRPTLVPVNHSPTFIKPDKRPPESKKKKDVLIVSDLDPLGDTQTEPLTVDDSSSDIEVIEDGKTKSELKSENKSDSVPSKDKVSVREVNHKKDSVKCKDRVVSSKDGKQESHRNKAEDPTTLDIDTVMRNLREMENSQETKKYNSNSYGGVITSAQNELL